MLIFASAITGTPITSPVNYNAAIALAAGDWLDFEVGFGGNSSFFDSTGIDAQIDLNPAVVPEPASLALVVTGLLGLAGVARRRRR